MESNVQLNRSNKAGFRFTKSLAKVSLAIAATVSLSAAAQAADTGATAPQLHAPWISCDDGARVAFRVVPPAMNLHNAFTHPIKVSLKPGQACADLK